MLENPYTSSSTPLAPILSPGRPRFNVFDKVCAFVAFPLAIVLLFLGGFGLIFGCQAFFTLPPVVGVIPAFAGWGTIRGIWVAWKLSNRMDVQIVP